MLIFLQFEINFLAQLLPRHMYTGYSSYNFTQIFLRLCGCFCQGLKMCMRYGCNPQTNPCHYLQFERNKHIVIFGSTATKVRKGAKIRSRYNQVPHPTQDTNGKVTNSQLDTTNESQEVSPFPAGDHKAQISRLPQRHSKHKTEQKHKRSTKEVQPWNGQ